MEVYTIAPHLPPLWTLATGILAAYHETKDLSHITVLLPNRRSCQALKKTFVLANNNQALLLPNIQPIGDIGEEEEGILKPQLAMHALELLPVIPEIEKILLLARFIEAWQGKHHIHMAQAVHLAHELIGFLSQVQKEQLSIESLEDIVPGELAHHWQMTLKFLKILIRQWPGILHERGYMDALEYRNRILHLQAEYWQNNPTDQPVIVAGSTGSIPAAMAVIKSVFHLPQGKIILPGMDTTMDKKTWQYVEEEHPQYGIKKLLEALQVTPEHVKPFGGECTTTIKTSLISHAMWPKKAIASWQHLDKDKYSKLENIECVTAPNLHEEATIIAMYLRQILADKGKTAALVTHNRELAKQVAAMMQKWDVDVDDSAGKPLSQVPVAVLLRLLAQLADNMAHSVPLLACLKHPLVAAGYNKGHFNKTIRQLEITHLRAPCAKHGLNALEIIMEQEPDNKIITTIYHILAPFLALFRQHTVSLKKIVRTHLAIAEQLAGTDNQTGQERLWISDTGRQMREYISALLQGIDNFGTIEPKYYSALFDALLQGKTYRPSYGSHPRVAILSPVEARMLQFDLVILGGLNEESWPPSIKTDMWMGRNMRQQFGLPMPEKLIGQSAHDFCQLFCAPHVLLTRSKKQQGALMLPSRWLLRLNLVLDILKNRSALSENQPWLTWAKLLHMPHIREAVSIPAPTPALHTRPQQLSVTAIETLMRDPYSIYASKILRLYPLVSLDRYPNVAEFGNFIHAALDQFIKATDHISEHQYDDVLLQYGLETLKHQQLPVHIIPFWWPRFERIAQYIVQKEKQRRLTKEQVSVKTEITGAYKLLLSNGHVFTVTAKADRLEYNMVGDITIIDYKTGSLPIKKDIEAGFAPQMALEGLIARTGGFGRAGRVTALWYWKITGAQQIGEEKAVTENIPRLLSRTEKGLEQLLNCFSCNKTPYLSCPDPEKKPLYNDYAHLARIAEWYHLVT